MVLWLILLALVLILAALCFIAGLLAEQTAMLRSDLKDLRSGLARGIDQISDNTNGASAFFKAVKGGGINNLQYLED